jgi:arylformamidase
MIAHIEHKGKSLKVDLGSPIDLSIPLVSGPNRVRAWYVDPIRISPVKGDGFIGSVADGGAVNFRDIYFNPHGHGTHTECVGHISKENYSVNDSLKNFFFTAQLISVTPATFENGDKVITLNLLHSLLSNFHSEALIIRTLPNSTDKLHLSYSGTNPPYLDREAMQCIVDHGVSHLLLDLPSVDREVDQGVLAAHHLFWNYPSQPELTKTITEMIFVPNDVIDGEYLLELQFPPFVNDASPSRPLIFPILS